MYCVCVHVRVLEGVFVSLWVGGFSVGCTCTYVTHSGSDGRGSSGVSPFTSGFTSVCLTTGTYHQQAYTYVHIQQLHIFTYVRTYIRTYIQYIATWLVSTLVSIHLWLVHTVRTLYNQLLTASIRSIHHLVSTPVGKYSCLGVLFSMYICTYTSLSP